MLRRKQRLAMGTMHYIRQTHMRFRVALSNSMTSYQLGYSSKLKRETEIFLRAKWSYIVD